MNVKHDALMADSWTERQMDKDAYREGVVVHEQCLTCSVFLVFLSCLIKQSDALCHFAQADVNTDRQAKLKDRWFAN